MNEENKARGLAILQNPALNKSTAFTLEERERLGLRGLLPPTVFTQQQQILRVMENLSRKQNDIERYIQLIGLQGRNERLFYQTVVQHIETIMPLIYTPTVGEACRQFANIFRQTRGFYVTDSDRGQLREILQNWPQRDIRVVVATDGERILGLGDLGASGMGIPIGKLALYTACAGIPPAQCLPVMLDVGTENREMLEDPMYLGTRSQRLRGDAYFSLLDEFVAAISDTYPDALLQFEDFATPNAWALLNRYRDEKLCFNDDIQGTASVALAGVFASTRVSRIDFRDLRVMFLGAGSAATGIADLMCSAFLEAGLTRDEALSRIWFADLGGLLSTGRDDLQAHNAAYAQDCAPADFVTALRAHRPHVLIGATGAPGTFTEEVIRLMSGFCASPTVFALSNPTSRAECTAQQAYAWSDGRVLFASGSPFAEVEHLGRRLRPGQGNNAYIFPGIGLGATFCRVRKITDAMFLTAARTLAKQVSADELAAGTLYPTLTRIREVSLHIATAVAEQVYAGDLARRAKPADLRAAIADSMYDPAY